MGCASSQEAYLELPEHLRPFPRSYSLHYNRGRRHRFSPNSPTPCSVKIDSNNDDPNKNMDFLSEVHKAKEWSEMIEKRMPKSSSPRDTEATNKLELIESVNNPLRHFPGVERSFSFNGRMKDRGGGEDEPKPPDSQMGVVAARRRKPSLAGLPPLSPSPVVTKEQSNGGESKEGNGGSTIRGMRARIAKFHEKIHARRSAKSRAAAEAEALAYSGPPGGQRKVS